jgi:hypothetical protein
VIENYLLLEAEELREEIEKNVDETGRLALTSLKDVPKLRMNLLRGLICQGIVALEAESILLVDGPPLSREEHEKLLNAATGNSQIVLSRLDIPEERMKQLLNKGVLFRKSRHYYLDYPYRRSSRGRRGSFSYVDEYLSVTKEVHVYYVGLLPAAGRWLRLEEIADIPENIWQQLNELGMVRKKNRGTALIKRYYAVNEPVEGLPAVPSQVLSLYLSARKGANRDSNEIPFRKLGHSRKEMEELVRFGLAREYKENYFILRKVRVCVVDKKGD